MRAGPGTRAARPSDLTVYVPIGMDLCTLTLDSSAHIFCQEDMSYKQDESLKR